MNIKDTVTFTKTLFSKKETSTEEIIASQELVHSFTCGLTYSLAILNLFETRFIGYYLKAEKRLKYKKAYPRKICKLAKEFNIEETDKYFLDHLARDFLKDISVIDILGEPARRGDRRRILAYNKRLQYFKTEAMSPTSYGYYDLLVNKKVLIISPHGELFKVQYLKRDNLFDKKILPPCKIAVIDINELKKRNKELDYFSFLDAVKVEILKLDFDIALLGNTIYDLSLAYFVTTLNKNVVAAGVNLDHLFGIYRDEEDKKSVTANDFWINLAEYLYENDFSFF